MDTPGHWLEIVGSDPRVAYSNAINGQYSRMMRKAQALGYSMSREEVRDFFLWIKKERPDLSVKKHDWSSPGTPTTWEQSGDEATLSSKGAIQTLEALLDGAGVQEDWLVKKWVANKWDSMSKDGPVPMWQVKAWLERIPEWANLQVQPIEHLKKTRSAPSEAEGVVLVVPDSQNGYRRTETGHLDPMHDRRAWDLAVQMAEHLRPDTIVLLGDMLDLAPWGSYAKPREVRYTTQPSLVELHWWLGQLRLVAPSATILYIEGNHEFRISRSILESLSEAEGVRPADDPGGHDAISIPRLLALDSLDIEYIGPYGEGFWLWDTVRFHHGTLARKGGGSTVAAMLKEATHSTIVGHIHRLEMACKTIHGPTGQRVITCMSPGTLCRTDGAVPAATPRVDWQQGLAVLTKKGDRIYTNVMQIHDGTLAWSGKHFEARDRLKDLRAATGMDF